MLLSLHGRTLDLIRPHLQPGARILALTSDGDGPAALARLLTESGFGASRLTVLEALGGPRERIRGYDGRGFRLRHGRMRSIPWRSRSRPRRTRAFWRARRALPTILFEHDGQITKREIRAVTLSSLAPRRGELLWDIGAGSGSVAIEWMLADPAMRAIAIERRADRAARIRRNAAAFGVPGLEIVEGAAPAALVGPGNAAMPSSSAAAPAIQARSMPRRARCGSGGRLVVNAVTLETEALLLARHAAFGGELIRIAISRAEPVGEKTGWRAAMPVTQWVWTKP